MSTSTSRFQADTEVGFPTTCGSRSWIATTHSKAHTSPGRANRAFVEAVQRSIAANEEESRFFVTGACGQRAKWMDPPNRGLCRARYGRMMCRLTVWEFWADAAGNQGM